MLGAMKRHKYMRRCGFILAEHIQVGSDSPVFVIGGNGLSCNGNFYIWRKLLSFNASHGFSLKHSLGVEMILLV